MKRGAEKQLTKEDADKEEKEAEEENKEEKEEKEETKTPKEGEKKEETPAFSFSFGTSASTGNAPFQFSFPSVGDGKPFSFGDSKSSGGFSFSFAPTIALSQSTESEKKEGEEDDDPEKDLTTNDGPVKVKTLSKEELSNGEENEENVYSVPKMKLYELCTVKEDKSDDESKKEEGEAKKEASEKKVWQERGLGVLRLNVDKKTKVARILIRREPTHQSVANFNLIHETKATVDGVRKQVTIQTIEPVAEEEAVESSGADEKKEDGEKKEEEKKPKAKISFYMIRVSSKEIAEELCAKINEHIPKEKKEE